MSEHAPASTPLTASRCLPCDTVTFPPKHFCPACGGRDLRPEPLPNEGIVFSYTAVPDGDGGLRRLALINVGGVRLLAPVPPDAPELAVGNRVLIRTRPEVPGYEVASTGPAPLPGARP